MNIQRYIVLAVLLSGSSVLATQYSVVDLTPSGSNSAVVNGVVVGGSNGHAILWLNGPGGYSRNNIVDLHPGGFDGSGAVAASGLSQVGGAYNFTPGGFSTISHAMLWTGTALSAVDLNPSGNVQSDANAVSGNTQVGYAETNTNGPGHAFLWHGSAASAVDLNPPGFYDSNAVAIFGSQIGGLGGTLAMGSDAHALLWNSSNPADYVDLNPSNFRGSTVNSMSANDQVGWGKFQNSSSIHPLLWHGTAASAIDLLPTGDFNGFAWATNGTQEVGYVTVGTSANPQAVVWNGSASSFTNLQSILPVGYTYSYAYAIDADGNIFGDAFDGTMHHAIEWAATPEPNCVAALGLAGLLFRKRRAERAV